MTKEEGINQVFNGGRHVVILGAGASIASAIRDSESNNKVLPSMDNLIQVIGLEDLLKNLPFNLNESNFEKVYSLIHKHNPNDPIIHEIEERIRDYFSSMHLPDRPTIYDYLILSLRSKDLVATFNWDPFLYQAFVRNRSYTSDLPHISFLHGNVAIGYSKEDKRCGAVGMYIRSDGGLCEPTKLLYPIENKNYTEDEFINLEWERVRFWLRKDSGTVRATIFGYGAPKSDVEAIALLSEAWGTSDERNMEQFEIIDISDANILEKRWNKFTYSHHYDIESDYFNSSLALNPRRTCESYFSHYRPLKPLEMFRENNQVPTNFETLSELWDWHKELISAESSND